MLKIDEYWYEKGKMGWWAHVSDAKDEGAWLRDLADAICSTEKMITYCRDNPAKQFVIVTESGIIHRMQKECPGKEFICAPTFNVMKMPGDNCRCSECKYMKMNTLEKVRDCMKRLAPRIELPAHILKRARLPIERMLEISARA